MPRLRNSVSEVKEDLSYYFQQIANGVANNDARFRDKDELINFAILDIVTSMFHSLDVDSMERFIDNLDNIIIGIRKYYKELSNATS